MSQEFDPSKLGRRDAGMENRVNAPFDAGSWMWDEAVAVLERAERRHRRFIALLGGQSFPTWEPPVDVFETEDGLRVFIALPGVRAEQVTLLVDQSGLVVRAERAPPAALACQSVRRLEIPYGVFHRRIDLPAGRYVLQQQHMTEGCLELHLTRE